MKKKGPVPNEVEGFTLIEIIISIGIISIAFYTFITLLGNVTFRNVGSQQLLNATFLAEQSMEEFIMEGKNWDTDLVSQATQSFGGDFPDFSYKVDVFYVNLDDLNGVSTSSATDYKRIEVTVTGEALDVPVKLTSFKANYNQ